MALIVQHLADRLPEKEDTTLGATARALEEAERPASMRNKSAPQFSKSV